MSIVKVDTLSCPRCECSLIAYADSPSIYFCSKCDGTLLPQTELVALLDQLASDMSDHCGVGEAPSVPDKGGNLDCPKCSGKMHHYGFLEQKHVLIDSCTQCSLVWTDADELAVMAELRVRSNSSFQARQPSHEERLRRGREEFRIVQRRMAIRRMNRRRMF